jgi:peptidyl-prolyl cis-trans isomerase C
LLNTIKHLFKEPLVHFLAIGAVIFIFNGFMGQQKVSENEKDVTITAGEITWLANTWKKRWNRPPTKEEQEGLVTQYVRETILYREAIAMGLDKGDSVIRRRLAQKLEFLFKDLVNPAPPSSEELLAYFEEHIASYQPPDLITMSHIFIDPDLRGDQTLKDAETIKAKVIALKQPPGNKVSFGDPFMLQSYYPQRSQAELAKLFGKGFVKPVFKLEPGQWHGPVLSGYGVHLVYIHEHRQAEPILLAEVEEQVRQDWEGDKREHLNEQFVDNLMARYDVTIEDVPVGGMPGSQKEQIQ